MWRCVTALNLRTVLQLGALLAVVSPLTGRAQDAATNVAAPDAVATTNAPGTLVLSIEHCLELALGGNVTLKIGRQEPRQRREDYYIAGETFTPTLFADGTYADRQRRTSSTQEGAEVLDERNAAVNAGVRKTWLPGTRTDLAWASTRNEDNSQFNTLNPAYNTGLKLNASQPLLRGFGLAVNRADLDRALLDREIADAEFEMLLESELLGVYRAYWDLVRAASGSDLEQESLRLAAAQADIIRNRLAVGSASALELTSAEAALARQQEAVITARNVYRKSADALLYRIRPSGDPQSYALAIVPSTAPDPGPDGGAVPDLAGAIAMAMHSRPELRLEQRHVERADIDLDVNRNGRKPDLALSGSYAFDGLGAQVGDAAEEMARRDFPQWTVGVTLEFLFDNASRRARWRQAVLSKGTAELRQQQAEAEIVVGVRAAVFDLETAIERRTATGRTLELARRQYEGELERLRVGSSTLFQVDTLRRDQAAAARNALEARVDWFVARAVLDAVEGRFAKNVLDGVKSRAHATPPE